MKKFLLVTLLIISCPRPSIKKIYELDYLKEAERYYLYNPIYSYNLLLNSVTSPEYATEKARVLVKIYLDQREYVRAAKVLDSLNWTLNLEKYQLEIILLKTKRWERLIEATEDNLLKGIAYYHLDEYQRAIEFLSRPSHPDDYRMLYLAKAYSKLNDYENSLITLLGIDTLSSYFSHERQNLLFNILFNIDDLNVVQRELVNLDDPALKFYVLLRKYKKTKDKKNLKKTAWELIKNYPQSAGAYHALKEISPKTKLEHKFVGKVYYHHNQYDSATSHLEKSSANSEVNYYLGRINYKNGDYSKALKYFSRSDWSASYYYRGRIYEILERFGRAIIVYDSLYTLQENSNYAKRGRKRMAFLLEDIGDTLKAVETFLNIDERNTKFRAAIQLYKVGKLEEATDILSGSTAPEFIYWQARVKEKLGEPVDNLESYLISEYPLSYYSLVRIDTAIVFDTLSLEEWINQLGDSTVSFTRSDSLHINNAIRFFNLNELAYAIEELNMIDATNGYDFLYLSKLCAQYGADNESIIYSLKLKKLARRKNIRLMPLGLYKLLYPVRYVFTITDQKGEISLCLAMIWQESLFAPEALSSANASGLMQIIPATAKEIARDLGVPSYSVNDAATSIKFGWYYFSNMLYDFNSVPLSLAGYNAGPHRVKRWITNNPYSAIDEFIELIPYNETRSYVKSVLARQVIYKTLLAEEELSYDSTVDNKMLNE